MVQQHLAVCPNLATNGSPASAEQPVFAEIVSASINVDLAAQCIRLADGGEIAFDYDPMRKRALIEGLDEIGMTLAMEDRIAAFQAADRTRRPWIYPHGNGP